MRKFLKKLSGILAKTLAVICALGFILTTLLSLLIFNIETRVFDAIIYKQALGEVNVYERLPGVLADEIVTRLNYNPCEANPIACDAGHHSVPLKTCLSDALGENAYQAIIKGRLPTNAERQRAQPCLDTYGPVLDIDIQDSPAYLKNLTAADWEAILGKLFTPEEIRHLAENILDQTFAFLNGETSTASVPVKDLKARLPSPAGVDALLQLMRAQPGCTPDQVMQLSRKDLGPKDEFPICSPPEEDLPAIIPNLQKALQSTADAIPEKIAIIETKPGPEGLAMEEQKASMQLLRTLMGLTPLVPLGFLLVISLVAVRSPAGWLRWWGIPIFVAGLMGVSMLWVAQPLFGLAFTGLLVYQFPAYTSPGMIELIYDLTSWLLHNLIEPMVLQALVLGVIGLVMLIVSFILHTKENSSAA